METIARLKKLFTHSRRTDRPRQPSVDELREQIHQAVLAHWPEDAVAPPARTLRELAECLERDGGNARFAGDEMNWPALDDPQSPPDH